MPLQSILTDRLQLSQQSLSETGTESRQPAADPAERADVLGGLMGRQIDDVSAHETSVVNGLVQPGAQVVDLRLDDPKHRIHVQVRGAGQKRLDADAVERAGS